MYIHITELINIAELANVFNVGGINVIGRINLKYQIIEEESIDKTKFWINHIEIISLVYL